MEAGLGGGDGRAVIGVGPCAGHTGHFALCPMVLRRLENNQQRFGSEHNVNQEAVEDGGEDRLVRGVCRSPLLRGVVPMEGVGEEAAEDGLVLRVAL